MIICPQCRSEVDDDSQFCDQCSARLKRADSAAGDEGPGNCPDCGGKVKDLGAGKGECAECGIRLDEAPEQYSETAEQLMFKNLADSIHAKLKIGSPLEEALAQSCYDLGLRLSYAAAEPPPAALEAAPQDSAANEPCPICSAGNNPKDVRCRECGIYFKALTRMECPRCFRDGDEALCGCGAILTLPRLMEAFDASIRSICRRCKQLYTASRPACADCGGPLASAENLKKRWSSR